MIKTKRLLLRRAQMDDLEDLHRIYSHPDAMRYWSSLPHENIEVTQRLLSAMVAASPEQSDDFVLEFEDRVIGKAGCWRMEEIGFILHPDFWGKGFIHEALSAAIPHIFETLPVGRLMADVDPRNDASIAVLARLGFRETGRAKNTILIGDQWCDSVYFELPRPE